MEQAISDTIQGASSGLMRPIFAANLERHKGWVSDYETVYTQQEIAELNRLLADFEKETGIEIVVVTLGEEHVAAN